MNEFIYIIVDFSGDDIHPVWHNIAYSKKQDAIKAVASISKATFTPIGCFEIVKLATKGKK